MRTEKPSAIMLNYILEHYNNKDEEEEQCDN